MLSKQSRRDLAVDSGPPHSVVHQVNASYLCGLLILCGMSIGVRGREVEGSIKDHAQISPRESSGFIHRNKRPQRVTEDCRGPSTGENQTQPLPSGDLQCSWESDKLTVTVRCCVSFLLGLLLRWLGWQIFCGSSLLQRQLKKSCFYAFKNLKWYGKQTFRSFCF